MDVARPYSAVVPSLDGEVLIVLAGSTKAMSVRQIASLAEHGSYTGIKKALSRLVEQGLVLREDIGPANLHVLNRQHVAVPAVEALTGLRSELLQRLRSEFASWTIPAAHASMFGSAARGDGDTASDIDLFIVRPKGLDEDDGEWRAQVAQLIERVFAWTGNRAAPIELAAADVSRLLRDEPPVLQNLHEDGIHLAGQRTDRLLM